MRVAEPELQSATPFPFGREDRHRSCVYVPAPTRFRRSPDSNSERFRGSSCCCARRVAELPRRAGRPQRASRAGIDVLATHVEYHAAPPVMSACGRLSDDHARPTVARKREDCAPETRTRGNGSMSLVTILIIVVIVLLVLAIVGRGRF
jgi:hypothetical protein